MTVAVVTGANSGIGKETCRALLEAGWHVFMVCRNPSKAQHAREELLQRVPSARISLVLADLSSMKEVRRAAAEIMDQTDRLDLLVNNAGAMISDHRLTVDGFEMTFAVNHFAYFLLTRDLLPLLVSTGTSKRFARVVNVASRAHKRTSMRWDDLMFSPSSYNAWTSYCQSKLANVLFSLELSDRLNGKPVTSNCLHPGVVSTGFARNQRGLFGFFFAAIRPLMIGAEKGAATTNFLAMSSDVEGKSGGYYSDCALVNPSSHGRSKDDAEKLWRLTEDALIGFEG